MRFVRSSERVFCYFFLAVSIGNNGLEWQHGKGEETCSADNSNVEMVQSIVIYRQDEGNCNYETYAEIVDTDVKRFTL
jgi:hypothetical protein